jgi:hypothetical protein
MEFGDDDLDESAQWRDPQYKGQLYTQEKPDYNDTREYDRARWDPKPKGYQGRKEPIAGGEFPRTDPLKKGQGIGRSGIKNNINLSGKRKGLPSRDQITSLKGSIRDAHGRHTRANLPEGMEGQVVFSGTGANGSTYEIIQSSPTDFMIHANGKHIDTYGSLQRAMSVLQNEVPGLQPGLAEGQLEFNTPDPVVVVQDLKGNILDKINLSVAAQKYKLGAAQNIKNQLAHQNYTTIGNYVIVSPMSGQPQDATTQGVAEAVGMMIKGAAISGANDQDIADRIAARTGGRVDSGSYGHHVLITYPTTQHRAEAAVKIRKMFPGIELYKSGGNRNAIDEQGMKADELSQYCEELVAEKGWDQAYKHARFMAQGSTDPSWGSVLKYLKSMKDGVAEAQTDYQRRRQRERDVDAGKPVKPQPRNPQNDYFARRKKEKEQGVDESWKSALGGAALAGSMAMGGGAAQAQNAPSGEDFLPAIVAHVTFKVNGNTVTKDINLGTSFKSPGQASTALEKFLKEKGIKFYEFNLERVSDTEYNNNYLDKTPLSDKGNPAAYHTADKGYTPSDNTAGDYMVKEGPVTKKPQPFNDPNWIKKLPKDQLDALAGKRYPKDKKPTKPVSEVSLGDYRKKAALSKATSQMDRFFGRDDPATVSAADQNIAKREKGMARADARSKPYIPPKFDAEKHQRDLTAKYPNIDQLVADAEQNRDPYYDRAEGSAYYRGREAEQLYQKLKQIQRVIQGLNESLDRSHLP